MVARHPRHERASSETCPHPRFHLRLRLGVTLALLAAAPAFCADEELALFRTNIEPVLDQYCYDCHGYGSDKGGVVLDGFSDDAALLKPELWLRALKNVRSGVMPPADEAQLPPEEKTKLLGWIKDHAFGLDPKHPDPGRVTLRRLNRIEYRNTVRELMGVDYDTDSEFPADDTGHGFDNIADVLTVSPMLLEKYLDAAQAIVARSVPTQPLAVAEHHIPGRALESTLDPAALVAQALARVDTPAGGHSGEPAAPSMPPPQTGTIQGNALDLLYYQPASVATVHTVEHAGDYQVLVNLQSVERYVDNLFDYNTCTLRILIDDEIVLEQPFVREGVRLYAFTFDRHWQPGEHEVRFEIEPTSFDVAQHRLLRIRLQNITVRGPLAPEYWVPPAGYDRFFPGEVPDAPAARAEYARTLLTDFTTRAFRRPVDKATIERLLALAEAVSSGPDGTFEAGIAQAMAAVLASPRFLFREEGVEPLAPGERYPDIDEYALASRLSYFLWSSMPDEELFGLARDNRLRANLDTQVKRMLADPRSAEFVRNFTGQWLQARDIATVPIESFDVFLRENPNPEIEAARQTFRRIVQIDEEDRTEEDKAAFAEARRVFIGFIRQPRPQLTNDLREAMRRETELLFEYIVKEDRSVVEFLDADYVHVNETLAEHYGIEGVEGEHMRKVQLPPDSPRGGVLTQGTVLAVTSNPTRTSPVKRGVFILDNILGAPPPPPPPNLPPLENVADDPEAFNQLSLREALALHAKDRLCRSCHNRMDPLGLALESFNAMGRWRDSELDKPIEPGGQLISGETFADIRELKQILVTEHRREFYYCLTEKLLTYALGRSIEYYDTETVDRLVARLEETDGRPSALISGIITSAPFQKRRLTPGELALLSSRSRGHAASRQP